MIFLNWIHKTMLKVFKHSQFQTCRENWNSRDSQVFVNIHYIFFKQLLIFIFLFPFFFSVVGQIVTLKRRSLLVLIYIDLFSNWNVKFCGSDAGLKVQRTNPWLRCSLKMVISNIYSEKLLLARHKKRCFEVFCRREKNSRNTGCFVAYRRRLFLD